MDGDKSISRPISWAAAAAGTPERTAETRTEPDPEVT